MAKTRRDGSGSVYRDGTGWRAQVRYFDSFTGESRTVRRRAASRDEARSLLKELNAEIATSPPSSQATRSTTVADYCQQWAQDVLPTKGVRPSTAATYESLIHHPLTPTLGKVTLADFDEDTARAWLARLRSAKRKRGKNAPGHEPLSQSTQRQAFTVLSMVLDYAVHRKLISANPLKHLPAPAKRRAEVPVLTADQVEHLLDLSQGRRIHPLLLFVANTGCRLGEALALRWEDIDLGDGRALITRGAPGADSTKTAAGRRSVPLVPVVVETLRAHRAEQKTVRMKAGPGWSDTRLVFTTGVGTAIDPHNARRAMRSLLRDAGLPTERPWHTLRHSLATRLLNRGVPMPVVSAIIGHTSIRTTVDIYGHMEPALSAELLAAALA